MLEGRLQLKVDQEIHQIGVGDTVYLKSEIPEQWYNPGPDPALLIWLKII